MNKKSGTSSLYVLLLLVAPGLTAQATNMNVPDAGQLLQQNPNDKKRPSLPAEKGLQIQQPIGDKLPETRPFVVRHIRITGNTLLPLASLQSLVALGQGQTLNLTQLGALAQKITNYYREQGYPLTRAIIPAQTITAGVVRFDIIEAQYGKIGLTNTSKVKTALLQNILAPLQSGHAISQHQLDSSLLLLSDVAGVKVNATLMPGSDVGSADMQVTVLPSQALIASVAVDNFGNRYTGRNRLGALINYSNPLGRGDNLSLNALASGSGMQSARIAYDLLLNQQGSHAGLSYSRLNYVLGDALASLQAHGTAQTQSMWIRHPLKRGQDSNLYVQLQYDGLQLRDQIDAGSLRTYRQLHNLTAGLSGDAQDNRLGGGINNWGLGLTAGQVRFDNAAAQSNDAAAAKTEGSFTKINGNLARRHNVSRTNEISISLSGQWTRNNLDSSQKMTVGGPYSVRAYDVGTASADRGLLFSIEWRHQLGFFGKSPITATAFFDSAYVKVNANPWAAGTANASFLGAGLGLNWTLPQQWHLRAYVATPLGSNQPAGSHSVQARFILSKGF